MALAKGAEMSDFNQAVLRCGSILAIKLGALNLLTVRSRMIKNDFTTGRPSKQAWIEDTSMPAWIGGFFKVALGAFGPSPPTERFSGLVANTVENEPLFMCLAVAVATLGTPGEIGATLVNTYLYGRCFHALVYLTPSPKFLLPYYTTIRATGFLAATFSMFALAASQL